MRLCTLPELTVARTDYQYFGTHVLINRLTVVILVAMYLLCPCNKSLLTHLPVSLLLAALGTAASRKVACRLLHENDTALSALNPYWRVGVDILDFRIVELLPMHPLCFLDKLRCRFPVVIHIGKLYMFSRCSLMPATNSTFEIGDLFSIYIPSYFVLSVL